MLLDVGPSVTQSLVMGPSVTHPSVIQISVKESSITQLSIPHVSFMDPSFMHPSFMDLSSMHLSFMDPSFVKYLDMRCKLISLSIVRLSFMNRRRCYLYIYTKNATTTLDAEIVIITISSVPT